MFFTFNQNNSGGVFHEDDNVDNYVIIEADNFTEANERAEGVGIYFHGCSKGLDCDCCGDRWSKMWHGDEGDKVPSIWGEPLEDTDRAWIVHYKNGIVEKYEEPVSNEKRCLTT
jgi:hypothetical protein